MGLQIVADMRSEVLLTLHFIGFLTHFTNQAQTASKISLLFSLYLSTVLVNPLAAVQYKNLSTE